VVRPPGGLQVDIEEGKEEEADTLASTAAGAGVIWVAEGGVGGVSGEDEAAPPAPLVCVCVCHCLRLCVCICLSVCTWDGCLWVSFESVKVVFECVWAS